MSERPNFPQLRKQVTVTMSAAEWRALRDEAARQRLSLAELCRRCLEPTWARLGLDSAAAASRSLRAAGSRRNHVWRID
jgi:hypothetical protein